MNVQGASANSNQQNFFGKQIKKDHYENIKRIEYPKLSLWKIKVILLLEVMCLEYLVVVDQVRGRRFSINFLWDWANK